MHRSAVQADPDVPAYRARGRERCRYSPAPALARRSALHLGALLVFRLPNALQLLARHERIAEVLDSRVGARSIFKAAVGAPFYFGLSDHLVRDRSNSDLQISGRAHDRIGQHATDNGAETDCDSDRGPRPDSQTADPFEGSLATLSGSALVSAIRRTHSAASAS